MALYAFRPTGACLDVPPEAAPADCWTGVQNATFGEGAATRPDGEAREFFAAASLALVPQGLIHAGPDVTNVGVLKPSHVYWAVGNNLAGTAAIVQQFGDTGVTPAVRTPPSWVGSVTVPGQVTGGVLNGYAFVNVSGVRNGLAYGSPGAISALTPFVPTSDWCFRAARPYKYHVIGLGLWDPVGLTDYPTRLNWSSAAPPGAWPATWAPAATNEAGSVDVSDCRGPLVDGGKLGEDFIVYAEGSTHLLTYVGGQLVMLLRGISSQSGLVNRNCWADLGGAHFAVTGSDVVLLDASGPRSIADGFVRRRLFGPGGVVQLGRAPYLHVLQHRARREVWVCYPSSDVPYCADALVWSVATGRWGHRTLRNQHVAGAAGFTRLTNLRQRTDECLLLASTGGGAAFADGRIYLADEPTTGSVYDTRTVLLQRHDLDLGEPRRIKQVSWVRPRFQEVAGAVTGIEVRAGGRNSATEAIAWGAWTAYAPATDDAVPISGVVGRLVSVEVRHQASTLPWRLVGLDIEFELRGRW
jgi:hypothetical protein